MGTRGGVARQLGGDAVPGQMVEPGAGPLQQVHRVAQLQLAQRRAHAGAAGLGDVDIQEAMTMADDHGVARGEKPLV